MSLPVQTKDNSTESAGIIICNACLVLTYHHHDTFALESNRIYIKIQMIYIAAFEWSGFRNGDFASFTELGCSVIYAALSCSRETFAFDIAGNPIDDIRIRAMAVTSPS